MARIVPVIVSLAMVGLFAASGTAAETADREKETPEEKAPEKVSPETIDALVAQLSSKSFSEREAANRRLVEVGNQAVDQLKRHHQKTADPEVKFRLKYVLDRCGHGGTTVGGLKVTLVADRTEVRPGETVTLTTTVRNLSDRPQNLYLGYSTSGVAFVSGSALRLRHNKDAKPVVPRWCVGFCGTGAGPLFATVPANSAIEYKSVAKLNPTTTPAKKPTPAHPAEAHYKLGYMTLLATESGTHRFRMAHTVTAQMNASKGKGLEWGDGRAPDDPTAKFWSGTIESNEVVVRVLGVRRSGPR